MGYLFELSPNDSRVPARLLPYIFGKLLILVMLIVSEGGGWIVSGYSLYPYLSNQKEENNGEN